MSEQSKSEAAPKQRATGRGTHRIFIDVPGYGWKLIGSAPGTGIPSKLLYFPEFSGKTIRAAIAHISVERGKPTALNKLRIENWKIGDDGRADMEDQVRHTAAMIMGKDGDSIATKEDIEAIKRCLGLGGG